MSFASYPQEGAPVYLLNVFGYSDVIDQLRERLYMRYKLRYKNERLRVRVPVEARFIEIKY